MQLLIASEGRNAPGRVHDTGTVYKCAVRKPLPLGRSAEGQHRQNFDQRFLLADQFLRGGAVGQNALGGNYVLVTLAPVPVPPLLPVKAPLGALDQFPKLVESGGILTGHLAAVSFDGDLHRVVLLFRFGVSEI